MTRLPLVLVFVTVACYAASVTAEQVIAVDATGKLTLAQIGKARLADLVFPDQEITKRGLSEALLGKELIYDLLGRDRYGVARIRAPAEEAILRQGIAVAYADDPVPLPWQAAEKEARLARRGIWAKPNFVLPAEEASAHMQEFHVIEGTVARIYRARNVTYLNFGDHWQTDFSITIAGRARRDFEPLLARISPCTRVRSRGMLYEENGPMLKLTHLEQLEIVN